MAATVLFDGDCGLCTRFLSFVDERVPRGELAYVSLGSPEARSLAGDDLDRVLDMDSMAVLEGLEMRTRSDAALFVAARMRRPWRWLRFLRIVPRPIRDWAYANVASRRQWFGPADSCPVHPGVAHPIRDGHSSS